MSASNLLPTLTHATLLVVVLVTTGTGWRDAMAQTVTEADIARAARSQPVITDDDVERARRKYRLPDESALRQVPAPPAPRLEALPAPDSPPRTVDLETLAKGYAANTAPNLQGIQPGPALLIFVSFSMPESTLRHLVDQAAKAQATVVIRGFVNGSLRDTVARTQGMIGNRQVAFQIDPQAFERFAVARTPTFVLVRDGARGQACSAGTCMAADAFVATTGDVSLNYALAFIARQAPRFAKDAQRYLKNLRG